MKSTLAILLILLFVSCSCTNKKNKGSNRKEVVHYFLFEEPLKKDVSLNQIKYSYSYRSVDPVYPSDSTWNSFDLNHYFEKDTFYTKSKLILDSIDCYDGEFFNSAERVRKFFEKRFTSQSDPLEIYVIEKDGGSDSVIFRRVNRFVMPYL